MNKSQKVAFIIPSLEPQASTAYPLSLYEEFLKKGYNCDLYYFNEKSRQLPCPDARKISFTTQIPWHQYNVVNTHGLIPDFYAFTHKPLLWRGRLISTLHGFFFSHFKEKITTAGALLLATFWMCILWRHDYYVVFTEYAKSQFPLLLKSKMRVVQSGIRPFIRTTIPPQDAELFHALRSQNKHILGAVCRIIETKGLNQILPALKAASHLHLVVVGHGPHRSALEEIAEDLGVLHQITFLGERPEGRNYMPYFDTFVMPSRKETFGLTMLESACAGTPIICSRIPTFQEIFTSHEVSFFDLDNTASLLAAIEASQKFCQQKISASQKIFLKKYTLKEMARNYSRLFFT